MYVNPNLDPLTVQLSDSADLTAGLGHPRADPRAPSARPCPLLLHLNVAGRHVSAYLTAAQLGV